MQGFKTRVLCYNLYKNIYSWWINGHKIWNNQVTTGKRSGHTENHWRRQWLFFFFLLDLRSTSCKETWTEQLHQTKKLLLHQRNMTEATGTMGKKNTCKVYISWSIHYLCQWFICAHCTMCLCTLIVCYILWCIFLILRIYFFTFEIDLAVSSDRLDTFYVISALFRNKVVFCPWIKCYFS